MAAARPRVVGRYALYGVLASGGQATVHLGCLHGAVGFSRIVAIKRMLSQYADDPDFVAMFLEEARIASRIRHPNVVPVIDVVASGGEVLLVMDYVRGETVSRLLRAIQESSERMPAPIVSAIMCDALDGLHAAHEALDDHGKALGIVHRDVSPQNIIVGVDGTARVLDFGIAKAVGRSQVTRDGQLKGKLAYMSPEQLHGKVTRATDIYAAGVVLWEMLANKRLFTADNEGETMQKILHGSIEAPSAASPVTPVGYDEVVLKALARNPADRYSTARELSAALAKCAPRAEPHDVGDWVAAAAKRTLEARHDLVSEVETAITAKETRRGSFRVTSRPGWQLALGAASLLLLGIAATYAFTRPKPTHSAPTTTTASAPAMITVQPADVATASVSTGASATPSATAKHTTSPPPPRPSNAAPPAASSVRLPDFL
jgi:serine/threonine-protein kinase